MTESVVSSAALEPVDQIDRRVIQLFALVSDAIAGATLALLSGDREAARAIVVRDEAVDALYHDVEQLALDQLSLGGGLPHRLRYLVAVLRLLPELERSGDLAEHVARRAERGLVVEMSARSRGIVERMGEVACQMWHRSADAYGERDRTAVIGLEQLDDEMDDLYADLTGELTKGTMPLATTMELVLIARFYERLGDHAVNLARRMPDRDLIAVKR